MKDTMVRSLQWISWQDPDIMKRNSRLEWPALLHNLCYLHSAIKLRARIGRGGWNDPSALTNISISSLIVSFIPSIIPYIINSKMYIVLYCE